MALYQSVCRVKGTQKEGPTTQKTSSSGKSVPALARRSREKVWGLLEPQSWIGGGNCSKKGLCYCYACAEVGRWQGEWGEIPHPLPFPPSGLPLEPLID